MAETTAEIRHDIEMTRDRISGTITELEKRVNVVQQVRENPWSALIVAFGAGLVLSRSGADVRAALVTSSATRETGSKLGSALDGLVATLVTSAAGAFHDRIDGAMGDIATAIRGTGAPAASQQQPTADPLQMGGQRAD